MIVYQNQKEFNQATFDNVARILSDYASQEIISKGNPADLTQEILEHLEYLAHKNGCNAITISTYLEIVKEQNQEIYDFENQGKLDKISPLGFKRGNVSNHPQYVTRG